MIYTDKELAQLVIAHCAAYDIEHVVISPGSRNAPLTIGFLNQKKFSCFSIVDERCAGFFALGMAQQLRKPVALVCTSGSALLNYYPAVAEAFYSDIPLVIISADRPKHLIDIGDGQTIRQENVFEKHTEFNANLIEGEEFKSENMELLSKAFKMAIKMKGPVHINVPLDEPLYAITESKMELGVNDPINDIPLEKNINNDIERIASIWNVSKKKMILVGSYFPNELLNNQLSKIAEDNSVLILTETISNLHHPKFINSIDKLIFTLEEEDAKKFRPEILLTFGGMVVSKKIKQLLRSYQPQYHWHIDNKKASNTYHCLTNHIESSITTFFNAFLEFFEPVDKSDYQRNWLQVKQKREQKHYEYIETAEFSDLKVFDRILKTIPDNYQLQLGNSSIVRYSQLFDLNETLDVFSNRGTSGIDGSTSTAIGAAWVSHRATLFITGDISFFYDSNALWNEYINPDFRIILVNNGGGGIFRIIPGPDSSNALNYFETPHGLTAKHLCEMYGIEYSAVNNDSELINTLSLFYTKSTSPKLLEIFTPRELNDSVLKDYFEYLR